MENLDMEKAFANITSVPLEGKPVNALKSSGSPFKEAFHFADYYDEKKMKAFIKSTEKLIRSSGEYNKWIELCRTNINELNYDNILSDISTADVDLEFHHYPFSLYDIVEIVASNRLIEKKPFDSFDLADEIMRIHFKHNIGFVPLTKLTHDLSHGGDLFIGVDQVFGRWYDFFEKYNKSIDKATKLKIEKWKKDSEVATGSDIHGIFL